MGRFLKKPLSYIQPIELSYVVTRIVELRSTRATSADRRAVPRNFFFARPTVDTAPLNLNTRERAYARARLRGSQGA